MDAHTVQTGEARVPPVAGDLQLDCSKAPGWLVLGQRHRVAVPPQAPALSSRGAVEEGNVPISQVWEWSPREGSRLPQGHTAAQHLGVRMEGSEARSTRIGCWEDASALEPWQH